MSLLEADIRLQQGAFSLEVRLEALPDGITVLFGPSTSMSRRAQNMCW